MIELWAVIILMLLIGCLPLRSWRRTSKGDSLATECPYKLEPKE